MNVGLKSYFYSNTDTVNLNPLETVPLPRNMMELDGKFIYSLAAYIPSGDFYINRLPNGETGAADLFIQFGSVTLKTVGNKLNFEEIPFVDFVISPSINALSPNRSLYKKINAKLSFRESYVRTTRSGGTPSLASLNVLWVVQYEINS